MVQPEPPATGYASPPWVAGWAAEEGARTAETLRSRRYDVRGNLADLVPASQTSSSTETPARQADDVTVEEVADAAVATLARWLVHETHQQARIERLKAQRQQLRDRLQGPAGP
jgi:hypothetical protein